VPAGGAKAGGPSARPLVGPVIPLTISTTAAPAGGEELLGGARPATAARPLVADPLAVRVLTKGEAIVPPTGRADDFNWPRGGAATVTAEPISPSPAAPASSASASATANPAGASSGSAPPRVPGKPAAAPAPGAATAYQRLELPDGQQPADDSKPRVARKPPAPHPPAPFANLPNFFR
jgi:hypothetical protein